MEERNLLQWKSVKLRWKSKIFRRNFTGQFLECIYGPMLNWAPFQQPARRGAPTSIYIWSILITNILIFALHVWRVPLPYIQERCDQDSLKFLQLIDKKRSTFYVQLPLLTDMHVISTYHTLFPGFYITSGIKSFSFSSLPSPLSITSLHFLILLHLLFILF